MNGFPLKLALTGCAILPFVCHSQPGGADRAIPAQERPPVEKDRRLFGIIPNYRSSPTLTDYKPLARKEKFKIAMQDSFDRGTFILAGMFAIEAQATDATPVFGQGVRGFAQYYSAAFGDFAIGDFMTEAIYPTLLHQDPRYFRRGTGGVWSRLGYAMWQILWTHKDSGGGQFNYSEAVGNSTAVLISDSYYRQTPSASDTLSRLGIQLGLDMGGNILKEFWPDLRRKLSHDSAAAPAGGFSGGSRPAR